MTQTRCILFGLGETGRMTARWLMKRGFTILAAYNRSRFIGQDLGSVCGMHMSGVSIQPFIAFRETAGPADIAIFCTTGNPADLLGAAKDCLMNGMNVLTIAEGAFFPWNYNAKLAAELHDAAIAGGATLSATGAQDAMMLHLMVPLTGLCLAATKIEFHCVGNFSRLGAASLGRMPLNRTAAQFAEMFPPAAVGGAPPMSTTGQVIEALATMLHLGKAKLQYSLTPVLAKTAMFSSLLRESVEPGTVCGMRETVSGMTPAGIEIVGKLTAKLFEPADAESFNCAISGPFPVTLQVTPLHSLEATAAALINRIPDILSAPPGFLTADLLPAPRLQP